MSELFPKCAHSRTDVRLRPDAAGNPRYWRQCLDCGEKIGTAVATRIACEGDREPEPFDEKLLLLAQERRQLFYAEQKAANRKAFFDLYDEYLASAAWREKRAAVLKRDGGICQGCMSRPATQVHHRTYEHVGDELLFELISLCGGCHDRAHGGRTEIAEAQEALRISSAQSSWFGGGQ